MEVPDHHRAKALLRKYASGSCTEEEKALLESWYLSRKPDDAPDLSEAERLEDMRRVRSALDAGYVPGRRMLLRHRLTRAAAVLALLAAAYGGYYFYAGKGPEVSSRGSRYANDVEPGGNRAVLTLADGKTISLSTEKEGIVVSNDGLVYNDGTALREDEDGALLAGARPGMEKTEKQELLYATLSTPAGGQYRLTLPDGTRVWLNAESSLRYPMQFAARERRVEVSGEAYFEVAHDPSAPFRVKAGEQTIEVLGTHFNVSAYQDESVSKTTLLEGSVKITSRDRSEYLAPGQQAQITATGLRITDEADLEEVTSWKDGYFKFNGNIADIMNKVARWYNVEVAYREGVNLQQTFSGEMSRSRELSALLNLMEITGNIHFKIEGRNVTVMP